MHARLRYIALALMLLIAVPEGYAQKKSKRRPAPAHPANYNHKAAKPQDPAVDISSTVPANKPLPQEKSLRPEIKKTKKVVIVPAPPPPPGRDPIPPYPKR